MHFAAFGKLMPYPIPKTLLRMKLTAILLFLFALQSTAETFAQVTLKEKNATLEKVLQTIKKQSGFDLVYQKELIKLKSKPVSVYVYNANLREALYQIFKNQDLDYEIIGKIITIKERVKTKRLAISTIDSLYQKVIENEIELNGRIVDEEDNPVNASITVKGKNSIGVNTNERGYFSLKSIESGDVLIISSIGYVTETIRYVGQKELFVRLRIAINSLDEKIVIAYGKTTKRYSTGSVSRIKSDDLNKQPVSDPISVLAGKIPGLQIIQNSGVPGSLISVRLRGRNSIANGNEPLYIVDGVPFPSTTLSGSFGGGGGIASSPFNNLSMADIESIEVLKDADATAIYGSRGANGVILITTKRGKQGRLITNFRMYKSIGQVSRKMNLLNTQEYISMRKEAFLNDGTVPTVSNARDLLLWDTTRYTDWQRILIGNTSHTTDVNVSVSGGSELTQFMFSNSYRNESTVFPGEFGQSKFSSSLNFSHKSLNNRLRIFLNTAFVFTKNNLPQQDFSSSITLSPNAPAIYLPDGSLNWENSTWSNPFAAIYSQLNSKTENSISNLNFSYNITKGLDFSFNTGYTKISTQENLLNPKKSFDPALSANGSAGFGDRQISTLIFEPQLNYKKNYEKSSFEALVGSTLQSTRQSSLYAVGLGYTSDDLLYSLRAASSILINSESDSKYKYFGIFGRLNYNYNKKYLATITARRDGSSRYGLANRYANFGSIGLGWIFSNENLFKNSRLLSFGKLRFSTGVTGNDQIGDYRFLDLYSPYTFSYQGVTTLSPTQLFNSRFNWEKVNKLEFGLETGFLNNRILININYYRNETRNQLLEYGLPALTGFNSVLQNLPARIQNTGLEIELNSDVIKTDKVKWNSTFNITIPNNKLIKFDGLEKSSYANQYVIGQPLFIEKRYQWLGVDPNSGNHRFFDYDGDGRITAPNDQQVIVNTSQTLFGGWENRLEFGDLSLSFLMQFTKQPYVQNYLSRFSRPGLLMNQPRLVLNRWRVPGDLTDIQKFANSNTASNNAFTAFRQSNAAFTDGSFIRLRNINLEYTILSKADKRKYISDLGVYFQIQNLLTISKYEGLDPETRSFLPPIRSFTIGINASF